MIKAKLCLRQSVGDLLTVHISVDKKKENFEWKTKSILFSFWTRSMTSRLLAIALKHTPVLKWLTLWTRKAPLMKFYIVIFTHKCHKSVFISFVCRFVVTLLQTDKCSLNYAVEFGNAANRNWNLIDSNQQRDFNRLSSLWIYNLKWINVSSRNSLGSECGSYCDKKME